MDQSTQVEHTGTAQGAGTTTDVGPAVDPDQAAAPAPVAAHGTSEGTGPRDDGSGPLVGWIRRLPRRGAVARVAGAVVVVVAVVATGTVLAVRRGGPAEVSAAPATAGSITATPAGTGVVAAGVDLPVVLGYRGSVTHVDVTLGQHVKTGQPLLGIDSEALNNAAAQLSSHLALDQAALDTLLADPVHPAEKITALRGQVALDQRLVEAAYSRTSVVRAPIDGVVGALVATPGLLIGSTTVLVELIEYAKVSVTATLPVAYFGQVALGARVTVTDVGPAGTSLVGRVTGVAPQTLAGGLQFQVIVTADNPAGIARPGTTAQIRVPLTIRAPVTVDALAVHDAGTAPFVFVVRNGHCEARPVVVGVSDGGRTQVLSGVRAGEVVAYAGTQQLADGDAVQVRKAGNGPAQSSSGPAGTSPVGAAPDLPSTASEPTAGAVVRATPADGGVPPLVPAVVVSIFPSATR